MNKLLESPKSDEGLKRGVTNFKEWEKKKRSMDEIKGKCVQFEKERDWFKKEALQLSN